MLKTSLFSLFTRYQEELFSLLLFFVCLLLLKFFPSQNSYGQTFTGFALVLVLLPLLFGHFILKKKLSSLGWQAVAFKKHSLPILGGLALSLIISLILVQIPLVRENYFINVTVIKSFAAFLVYELLVINILTFLETAFFQGFLIGIFRQSLGKNSVLVSFLLFLIYLFTLNGFDWSMLPFIAIILITSFVSYYLRTFFWSYGILLITHILLDAYLIHAIH